MNSKLIGKNTNKDDIIAYLTDPESIQDQLTKKQQELLDWYIDAYTLMRNYNSIPDTIAVMIKLSEKRGERISMSTARRYIYDALDIFGGVNKMKPDAIKHLAIEMLLDAAALAKEQKNPLAIIAASKELRAAGGVDDPNAINPDDLERHDVYISLDKRSAKMLEKLVENGPIDLDSLMNNRVEDIEYEDLNDAESE
ncbi:MULTISPECIES: hypothetical protein [Olivibacter]|uniref:Uncharacterized protein n=1 Tax=Olivibacter jilunii TaxID=985016 RepID=A0ABW6AYU9_9SPHI